jgi:hypothetical protein
MDAQRRARSAPRILDAMVYATGPNYRIELDGDLARCHVWRRPDLDPEVGARIAEELARAIERLAVGSARAMILDLRDAPVANGPRTQAAIARMLRGFEAAGRPMALLFGNSQVQLLQLRRLAREHAPTQARAFAELAEAESWAKRGLTA